jgi:hypothetical protein
MTHLVFGQPIRQPVHLHSDGRKRSHLRYPLTARTRNTQANNKFRLPDIDTSTPADHHILTSLRPPNPFPAMGPGGITPVNGLFVNESAAVAGGYPREGVVSVR